MSNRDYFEEKTQEVVHKVVAMLIEEWKSLNPHEPDLQSHIEACGDEFLAHVRRHEPVEKRAFACDSPYKDEQLTIEIKTSRRLD